MMEPASGPGELRRQWRELIAIAFALAFGAGLNHYASNLFGPALLAEFGWSKAQLAFTGVFSLVNIVFVIVAGRMTDRFGARAAASVGFGAVALAYLAYSAMSGDIREYYAITAFHMVFGVLTSSIVFGRVIVQRFSAARGIALSLAMTGPPLAAALIIPQLGELIAGEGWRAAYQLMALFAVVAGIVAVIAIGPSPRIEQEPMAERPSPGLKGALALVRNPALLLLIAGMFLCNIPQILVAGQLNIMLIDNGATAVTAAWIASLYAGSVIAGRFATGLALDRFPAHRVALFALGMPVLGYVALALPLDPVWLLAGAVLLIGLAQGAEGDLGAYLCAQKMGTDDFSFAYSFLIVSLTLGYAAGSGILAGLLQASGSFDAFLIVCAAATALGTAAFVLTGRTGIESKGKA